MREEELETHTEVLLLITAMFLLGGPTELKTPVNLREQEIGQNLDLDAGGLRNLNEKWFLSGRLSSTGAPLKES